MHGRTVILVLCVAHHAHVLITLPIPCIGIVHRDVKPQNCIISLDDRKLKFIDLGAAADLRVGINCESRC